MCCLSFVKFSLCTVALYPPKENQVGAAVHMLFLESDTVHAGEAVALKNQKKEMSRILTEKIADPVSVASFSISDVLSLAYFSLSR